MHVQLDLWPLRSQCGSSQAQGTQHLPCSDTKIHEDEANRELPTRCWELNGKTSKSPEPWAFSPGSSCEISGKQTDHFHHLLRGELREKAFCFYLLLLCRHSRGVKGQLSKVGCLLLDLEAAFGSLSLWRSILTDWCFTLRTKHFSSWVPSSGPAVT